MNINTQSNITHKGYDIIPLKGLYMQGLHRRGELSLFREMKKIAQKEGLDIFHNASPVAKGSNVETKSFCWGIHDTAAKPISKWGQDYKAFVLNRKGKTILCNLKESPYDSDVLYQFCDYRIDDRKYAPRGGNYYLGYKPNGDKWILINGHSIATDEEFAEFGNLPTDRHLQKLFDIKSENMFFLSDLNNDLDEIIRPVGYPYILVNDYRLALNNLEKMKAKFPDCDEIYQYIKNFLTEKIKITETTYKEKSTDQICEILTEQGFKPIRIAGRYGEGINYMNSLAFLNNKNGVSFITNSTKGSYPELEYLEKIFEQDLKERVKNVTDVHFVSGGTRTNEEKNAPSPYPAYDNRLKDRNVIMDILANDHGGIHCMTAEIPDFEKIMGSKKV